jgi:CrcB protein
MSRLLLVSLGGAFGTALRYLITGWTPRLLGPSFPFGTLFVNTAGSFVMGVIMTAALSTSAISPTVRVVLTTGVLGGFTTFSTFSYETLNFIESGSWSSALLNVVLNLVLCLAAGALGILLARALTGAPTMVKA